VKSCPTRDLEQPENCTKCLVRGMFPPALWEVQLLSRAPHERPQASGFPAWGFFVSAFRGRPVASLRHG